MVWLSLSRISMRAIGSKFYASRYKLPNHIIVQIVVDSKHLIDELQTKAIVRGRKKLENQDDRNRTYKRTGFYKLSRLPQPAMANTIFSGSQTFQ